MNRLRKLFLTAIILILLPCQAAAVDMDYNGVLDSVTGAPVAGDSADAAQKNLVAVSSGVVYSKTDRCFLLGKDSAMNLYIQSNIAGGMVTTDSVSFQADETIAMQLYRDGVLVEDADLSKITQRGQYILKVGQDQDAFDVTFTIVSPVTGTLNAYTLPAGFSLSQVYRDGEATANWSNYISMSEEGEYEIEYLCTATGLSYRLNVTVDHTPPVLALEAVENGKAGGPVDLSDLEEGATLTIFRNDEEYAAKNRLNESGHYSVIATDAAGNSTTYNFTIMVYFDTNSFAFLALLLLAVGGTIGYLLYSKKHLRIC